MTRAVWLFAVSTMISWSYCGEQGVPHRFGAGWVRTYEVVYCGMILVATVPSLITTDEELDDVTTLGTGVMLWANIPILLVFAGVTMRRYRDYRRRLACDVTGRGAAGKAESGPGLPG